MDINSYILATEVPATGPIEHLVKALQRGYDNGAAGTFQVIVTMQPTYMVLFVRTTADDDEQYLLDRMAKDGCTVEEAAMRQLAAELDGAGQLAKPVIEVLEGGDAQIVDFNAVLATVGEE